MNIARGITAILFFLGLVAISGAGDYEQEVRENQRYCEMVKEGLWPDFNLNVECGK